MSMFLSVTVILEMIDPSSRLEGEWKPVDGKLTPQNLEFQISVSPAILVTASYILTQPQPHTERD